ncbi:hypothetical protein LRLP16767_LRLP167_00044 [Limosilactobacillus reuteri]|uniref:Uncharacterized protein n=1 Tax=Limosilactobacillus reuteri TaxID=1598 RepID=A0A0U5JZ88_LIMRT|nr:hypothetical protein LRLP16767_LRLP167_00044 [Limosilactobacillus reuteri]
MLISPTLKQKEIIGKNVALAKSINELDCDYNTYSEFVKIACGNLISEGYPVTEENVVSVSNAMLEYVKETKESIETATFMVIVEKKF